MKFDRSNKFDFSYYGQINSVRLKSSVASKFRNGQANTFGGNTYFAGDGESNHIHAFICIYIYS